MTYPQFHEQWHRYVCFSTRQVRAIYHNFNRSNYLQWQKAGYICSLRQGWYAFTEYISKPDYANYIANKIYSPSYISLHTALSFYGLIPEAVVAITSVSTMKTQNFKNGFAYYSYQNIRPTLFFGYEPRTLTEGRTYMMATLEKAILDLLYLYPEYKSLEDMHNLRFDDYILEDVFNKERFWEYLNRIDNKALTKRAATMLQAYNL